jgi:hypothetical protein
MKETETIKSILSISEVKDYGSEWPKVIALIKEKQGLAGIGLMTMNVKGVDYHKARRIDDKMTRLGWIETETQTGWDKRIATGKFYSENAELTVPIMESKPDRLHNTAWTDIDDDGRVLMHDGQRMLIVRRDALEPMPVHWIFFHGAKRVLGSEFSESDAVSNANAFLENTKD